MRRTFCNRGLKNLSRPKVELAQFGVLRIDARKFARMWAALISQALIDKLQIIERYNHRMKRCCMVSQDDGTSSCDRRAIECPKPGNVPIINGSFNVSAPPLLCGRRSGRNRFHCRTHQNGWATPNRFGPLLDGRDGRPSIPPERLLRGCCCRRSTRCQNNTNSRWAIDARTVASCGRCRLLDTRSHDDHWTKCRHPETAHNTVSSYDCTVR